MRRSLQHGGYIHNIYQDNRKKLTTFNTDSYEIIYKIAVDPECTTYKTKMVVHIPFKIDADNIFIQGDAKDAKIEYFSDQGIHKLSSQVVW